MAVAMAALDALVRVLGPNGERTIPFVNFHRLPGDESQRDTMLEHGELITAVDLPPLAFAARSHYRKVRDRASYAFALVSVAAAIEVTDGIVRDVRIAFGGVAHVPWRATKAEVAMYGAPATEETFRRGADAELADARPLPGNAFKVPLARNVLVRTLLDLIGEENQG
jgi:xanthine dehydrogenase YagS FAD-binding subunit